jgi:hypothetical protein
MADEQVPAADVSAADIPVASPRTRRLLRLFLMVAGGLAAPCLALAAFFLTSSGSDPPARPGATQAGLVTATTSPKRTPVSATPTTTATTTTTAPPAAPAGPLRDPFASLVNQAPAAGTPAR